MVRVFSNGELALRQHAVPQVVQVRTLRLVRILMKTIVSIPSATGVTKLLLGMSLFCLLVARPANADVDYRFALPANGAVSAFSIDLRFPDLLAPDGLMVFTLATSPEVASFSFTTPGLDAAISVVGLQITPTATLVGVSLRNAAFAPLLFTDAFPGDFFVFPRLPLDQGGFVSTSGTVVSILALDTATPIASLTVGPVTAVSAPATLWLLGLGLLGFGAATWRGRRT